MPSATTSGELYYDACILAILFHFGVVSVCLVPPCCVRVEQTAFVFHGSELQTSRSHFGTVLEMQGFVEAQADPLRPQGDINHGRHLRLIRDLGQSAVSRCVCV